MRLKTKLILSILGLVFLISGTLSLVFVSQLIRSAIVQTYDTNALVARQIRYALQLALESGLRDRKVDPNNPSELRALAANAVRSNLALKAVVESVNRNSLTVYDINIADDQNRALLSTNPQYMDRALPLRPNYLEMRDRNPIVLLSRVFGPPKVYEVVVPLERNGALFATVRVGVRTTLLRAVYQPWLTAAITLIAFAMGTGLVAAFLLANLALRPMEDISLQLDYWNVSEETAEDSGKPEQSRDIDTVARVTSKIDRIGQRMRNVEEVFSALKENLDQILGNLQDGILLFTGDGHAVLVSDSAGRFLNTTREELLGKQAREIFDRSTVLGALVRDALDAGVTIVQEEVLTETGRRVQVSLDFILDDRSGIEGLSSQYASQDASQYPSQDRMQDRMQNRPNQPAHRMGFGSGLNSRLGLGLGTLLTLHDLESVQEIESELELSRRMAAIGRLTSGVGHEVKNPINAIVVHLELLRNKLGATNAPAAQHLRVIEAEIRRLDRVVETLVDFSRPVEVRLVEQDLRPIVSDVLILATAEFSTWNVTVETRLPSRPLVAKVDADLLKQAVLNVARNGAQAMPQGGMLSVALEENRNFAVLRIRDQGEGIPEETRERIFDLYFTTKKGGSGIGLAMTYRILQLHHGAIDVQSGEGRGTEFLLRIPLAVMDRGRRHLLPVEFEPSRGFQA